MGKPKQTKQETFADLIADSQPITDVVEVGDHSVLIQELSGRERFELGAIEESETFTRWDTMLWVCLRSIVDPKPADIEELERLNPKWIVLIASAAMKLSGISVEEEQNAENESAAVSEIGGS